jgi:hypothetical protein
VTACMHALDELAPRENDYWAQVELPLVTEQVEEKKSAQWIEPPPGLTDARGTGVPMLGHQLGKRGG